jgi:hypothetical protein
VYKYGGSWLNVWQKGYDQGGGIMNRNLILTVGVLALTAVSKTLFAAEAETPAPTERAAPAAERAPAPTERAAPAAERAPARERAAPARQRQAAAPQQSTSSQTSSYTGVQGGGFGGGNVGGGGFADPVCLGNPGSQSSFPFPPVLGGLDQGCTPAPFSQSLTKSGGTGGAVVQWMVPVTQQIVVGVVGDASFGKTTTTQTQNNLYTPDPRFPSEVTQEQITNSFSQSTSQSARLKVGFVIPLRHTSIMPYFTAGYIHSTLQGTFSYSASNYNSASFGCFAFNPQCSTNAFSSTSWSRSSNGFVWGFGAEMPLSAFVSGFGPGVVLVADYTRAQFGSFDVNSPVAIASSGGLPCQSSFQTCAAVDTGHFSNVVSNRFTFGARIKLF